MAKRGKQVQVAASTGKAATAFHEPFVHSMLGVSFQDGNRDIKASDSKCVSNAIFYENTDLFIIDEINMGSAQLMGLIDDILSKSFNPQRKKGCTGDEPPCKGKRVVLVGDPSQLPCVKGLA